MAGASPKDVVLLPEWRRPPTLGVVASMMPDGDAKPSDAPNMAGEVVKRPEVE